MTDEQLMILVQGTRDESAMAQLVTRSREKIVQVLTRFGAHIAETLADETFEHIRQHPESYDRSRSFNVWLVDVAIKIGCHHIRRAKALGVKS